MGEWGIPYSTYFSVQNIAIASIKTGTAVRTGAYVLWESFYLRYIGLRALLAKQWLEREVNVSLGAFLPVCL